MKNIVEIIKLFSDQTRLRILNILYDSEHCVCDLEAVLEMTQPNISKHIKKMSDLNILKKRKQSYWIYYSLNNEIFEKYDFVESILRDIRKEELFQNDLKKLKKYLDSPKSCHI
ncbi:ArsR/SmtB family transcription factor [Geotoga petraea]|uniref:ArsR family transcriptional regulator n=1 Tax=Geotoga petraea TaxID=28234 RepID=A0A4Z0W1B6_9BACT|nr:metalloregulator ArsR/SmtB family transcription factor [Geotoga petraea]TGG88883.1 ArsR family transcriptional regulator [Geotoga petraea]